MRPGQLHPLEWKEAIETMRVLITSDSTCDLSPELVTRYGIGIIPLTVTLGDNDYKDGIDLTPDQIYPFVEETGILPKTSAVNTNEYIHFFRDQLKSGDALVHFCISSKFSSSYQNAVLASEQFDNVFVVDSQNLSTGQGLLVLKAAEYAAAGMSAKELFEKTSALAPKVEASFVINTLDYLHKGGRCSALAMLGANLLHLKPCIEVIDGGMEPKKKYRGLIDRCIVQYVSDRLKDRDDLDYSRIFITHTACSDTVVEDVRKIIRELAPDFEEILETTAGCTITTHCGPNTLGILFIRK
jgi:DegV family protein with EDD domain